MANDLPKDYDVIVVGTGMVECIFAAAAARIGKSVLHVDKNGFYGGDWASFNLDQLRKFVNGEGIESTDDNLTQVAGEITDDEVELKCGNFNTISNVCERIYVKSEEQLPPISEESSKSEEKGPPETSKGTEDAEPPPAAQENSESNSSDSVVEPKVEVEENSASTEWSWQKVTNDFRKFNIDLSPKLLFSRGDLVELLISSNVARYAEYKCLTRILTYTNKLEQVPCSRSDVFSTKHISIIDKRMLMQLLNYCLDTNLQSGENEEFETQLFTDFLKKRKLSDNVCHYVIHAIAMVPTNATVKEGLIATQKFLKSLGRFGNTPFLWPMYGSGELPQCFCRLCAVFGGIYCLRKRIESIVLNAEKACTGIVSEGQRFNCKLLVMNSTYAPTEYLPENLHYNKVSRAVLITTTSLIPASKEQISLLRIPPSTLHNAINFLELPPGSMVCPEGLNIVHATAESLKNTAREDLSESVEFLFSSTEDNLSNTRPQLLYDLYFNIVDTTKCDLNESTPENLLLTSNSGATLDFDNSVIEAKKLFTKAFPDSEFLPRAPDPDEIILDSNDEEQHAEEAGGFGSTERPEANASHDVPADEKATEEAPEVSDEEHGSGKSEENLTETNVK